MSGECEFCGMHPVDGPCDCHTRGLNGVDRLNLYLGDPDTFDPPDLDDLEYVRDKVEGLDADLKNAVEVAWNRGATEWVKMNYPADHDRLSGDK